MNTTDQLKSIWAVIKGERLNAKKSLNRNAGFGLFYLGIMIIGVVRSGKIAVTPFSVIIYCICIFTCYSWLTARKDDIRRNELLVIQGKLGMLVILISAVWFIIQLHSIAHPAPGTKALVGGVGYAPGIIGGAFFYFGRHISDFSETFKIELNKYTMALLAVSIPLEAIIIFKLIEAINVIFARI